MVNFFKDIMLSFIPLFVAVDALGVLPMVLGLTGGLDKKEQSRMIRYALLTSLGLGLGFVVLGKLIFNALSISDAHFLVAGGLILFLLAARDLLLGERWEVSGFKDVETIGVFPIGIPLIVGPAVLTTLLVLIGRYSIVPVLIAFLLNLAFTWLVFAQSARIGRALGRGGLGAASKIALLLLATIAVGMIDRGIVLLIQGGSSLL